VVGDAVAGVVTASSPRLPAHEFDAVYTAFLVATDKAGELEESLERVARSWTGRVELRLIGPLAAYDFASAVMPGADG